jgi:hypothetical protein
MMKYPLAWALATVFGLSAMTAQAAEVSLSGFGTLGYAKSNQPYNFERFVNNNGTFARDSVAGVQADIKLTDQIGATIQGKFAPSLTNDAAWDTTLSWAFLSWRPSNDWLVRLGKQRLPLYFYSESTDVGVTYDLAHLPSEMYSISPSTDYIGASASKTWNPDLGELTLDGYVGSIGTYWRTYQRDNVQIPGSPMHSGANYRRIPIDTSGLGLTLLREDDKYRASIHKTTITAGTAGDYLPAYLSQVQAASFIPAIEQSYGLPAGTLAGTMSGSAYTVLPQAQLNRVYSLIYTLSAEINLPSDFRLIGEYGRRKVTNIVNGVDTNAGYLALLKDVDAWTPYVSCALIKSRSDVLSLYQAVNGNANGVTALTPLVAAAAAGINASQRVLADGMMVYDQKTIALGASYRLSPTQKIKMEWARTHVGVASSFVDAASQGNVSNQNIDVLSFSYNFVF